MAINRFRRLLPQLDPTFYSWKPQEYMPDIEAIGATTTGLQGIYDSVDYLDMPKHLEEDVADVKSRYIDPVEQLKQQAVEAFTTGDTGTGIRSFKDIKRFLHKAKQPGGVYNQFEQSYQAYQDYNEELDTLYSTGKIGDVRRDALKRMSKSKFEGSFKDDKFSPFSGIGAAFEQERLEKGLEIGKGWKADKFPKGIFKTAQGYFRHDTKTRVDADEVFRSVYNGLASDQAIVNDLRQEGMIKGHEGEALLKYMDAELKDIARIVGEKEGFEAIDSKFLKDWQEQENIRLRNKYRIEDYKFNMGTGQHETRAYTVNTGMKELEIEDGKVVVGKTGGSGTTWGIKATTPRGLAGSAEQNIVEELGVDQLINKSSEFAKEYPALVQVVNEFPRLRDANGVESNIDYNKRMKRIYDKKRESLATAKSSYTGYGPNKRDNRTTTLVGKGERLGDIQHKTLWIKKAGSPPQPMNYEQTKKMLGLSDEEFIKKANVLGEERALTSVLPSGEEVGITDNKGNTYQFIVENINYEDAAHKKDIYAASMPLRDATVNETDWYVIGGEKLKSVGVDVWSEEWAGVSENNTPIYKKTLDEKGVPLQYRRQVHIIGEDGSNLTLGIDKDGNPIIDPETGKQMQGVTLEELEQINKATNPLSPIDFNTRGERELENKVPIRYE